MSPYIQSQLTPEMHTRLEELARRRKISLKEAVQEAIEEYLRHEAPAERDPIWDIVGTLDLPPGNWSERKNWRFPELD